jgi:hypothetical protein
MSPSGLCTRYPPLHDTQKLQPFQEHVLAGIREVDREGIVWFEPNVIFNSGATVHDFTAAPFRCTVQAPQSVVSQPTCVPVRPSTSRR